MRFFQCCKPVELRNSHWISLASFIDFALTSAQFFTFAELLAADSDHALPDSDDLTVEALQACGAIFSTRGESEAAIAARADLFAGFTWLHLNHTTLDTDLARASPAQQQVLAKALGLDYGKLSGLASWPAMVERRVLRKLLPGNTPVKRLRPVDSAGGGHIAKPGTAPQPQGDGSADADASASGPSRRAQHAAPRGRSAGPPRCAGTVAGGCRFLHR